MNTQAHTNQAKIVVYGGNGFVGTHVAEQLVEKQAQVVCVSRSGDKPVHLQKHAWSKQVTWATGDASEPDIDLLTDASTMVCLVGSPPLPTFSKQAYQQQVFMNGTTCVNAIQAAQQAGVKNIILLGAQIPLLLRTDYFGYAKGKKLAVAAATEFAESSETHTAVVLQPGAIYGKRHLASGSVIRLDLLMAPLAKVMPWQFISVQAVAKRIADAAFQPDQYRGGLRVLSNREISLD